MALNVGELYALFTIDAGSAMSSIGTVNSALITVGNNVSQIGLMWTSAFTRPIKNGMQDIIQTGMDFDAEMAKVRAKANIDINTEDGIAAYEALRQEVIRVAKDSVYNTAAMAGAYDKMAMAGWRWESMVGGLEPIADLAAASGEGLVGVSDIVTDAMTAFGLTWENALNQAGGDVDEGIKVFQSMVQHFSDVLASAATRSNTDVAMMGQSFKYAAAMAGTLNYSIDDVAIALGLMANRGIKASQAGTSLRRIITNIVKPSKEVNEALLETGISLHNLDTGEMYNFMELMQELRQNLSLQGIKLDAEDLAAYEEQLASYDKKLEEHKITQKQYNKAIEEMNSVFLDNLSGTPLQETQLRLAATIAGARALPSLLAIVTASEEEFNSLRDAIYGSEGATHQMKETMLDTAQGDLEMFLSTVDTLKVSIAELVDDKLRGLLQDAKSVIDTFIGLDDETKMTILNMAGIAAAIGPVLVGVGMLTKLLPALGSAFSFVASPLGLITVALGAFAVSALDTEGKVGKAISEIGKAFGLENIDLGELDVSELLDGFLGDIGDLSDNPAVTGFMEKLGEGFKGALGMLGDLTGEIVGYIFSEEGAKKIFNAGGSILKLLVAGFESGWTGLWEFGRSFWEGLENSINSAGDFKLSVEGNLQGNAYATGIQDGAAYLAGFTKNGMFGEGWFAQWQENGMKRLTDWEAEENAAAWAKNLQTAYEHAANATEFASIWHNWEKDWVKADWTGLGYESADEWWGYVYEAMKEGYEHQNWGQLLELVAGIGSVQTEMIQSEAEQAANAADAAFDKIYNQEFGGNETKKAATKASDEAIKGMQGTLADGKDEVADAAAEVSDAAVQAFLLTMSEENGTALAVAYMDAITLVISDPDGTLQGAAETTATMVVTTFQTIMAPDVGASIGSAFGNAIASSVSAAADGIAEQVASITSSLDSARQMVREASSQLTVPTRANNAVFMAAGGHSAQGTDAGQIAAAVRGALNGASVNMDGQKVGNIVTPTVSENIAAEAAMRG